MRDALGVEREPGMPYCEKAYKDTTGMAVLVYDPRDGSRLWRFRNGQKTVEAKSFEWTDPRAFHRWASGQAHRCIDRAPLPARITITDPSIWSQIIGTLLIVGPLAYLLYLFR